MSCPDRQSSHHAASKISRDVLSELACCASSAPAISQCCLGCDCNQVQGTTLGGRGGFGKGVTPLGLCDAVQSLPVCSTPLTPATI
jgi:hypothetical protein